MKGAPGPHTPALAVEDLGVAFGGVQALAGVSFAVPSGTVTVVIGPNGAGKTTLFNLITNLLPAGCGSVRFFGDMLAGLTAERIAASGLIRAFQSARIFPGMTVLENALAGAHRLHPNAGLGSFFWTRRSRQREALLRARAEGLLEVAGLAALRDAPAHLLPMGGQKLLEVVRALMACPRVLLLDEPAAGLNDTETAELSAMLRAIRDGGITLLVIEHNMSLVMDVADEVVVLDAGRVIASGSPAAIQADEAVIAAYVGRHAA